MNVIPIIKIFLPLGMSTLLFQAALELKERETNLLIEQRQKEQFEYYRLHPSAEVPFFSPDPPLIIHWIYEDAGLHRIGEINEINRFF